jgi:hypothetical protein
MTYLDLCALTAGGYASGKNIIDHCIDAGADPIRGLTASRRNMHARWSLGEV